jgi:hypothetical protein
VAPQLRAIPGLKLRASDGPTNRQEEKSKEITAATRARDGNEKDGRRPREIIDSDPRRKRARKAADEYGVDDQTADHLCSTVDPDHLAAVVDKIEIDGAKKSPAGLFVHLAKSAVGSIKLPKSRAARTQQQIERQGFERKSAEELGPHRQGDPRCGCAACEPWMVQQHVHIIGDRNCLCAKCAGESSLTHIQRETGGW